jgi:CheY-like chemotaxis protein
MSRNYGGWQRVSIRGSSSWMTSPRSSGCWSRHQPHVMVLDVMMPRMDGWSVLEAVGKLPEESRPHVVMVTALASAPDRERAERLGAVAYVTKPFDMDQLVQVLHGCLALAS